MFKIIMLVRKKASLTGEEFIKLWEAHSQKVIKYKEVLHIKDYAKTFPFIPTDDNPLPKGKHSLLSLKPWGSCGTKKRRILSKHVILQKVKKPWLIFVKTN